MKSLKILPEVVIAVDQPNSGWTPVIKGSFELANDGKGPVIFRSNAIVKSVPTKDVDVFPHSLTRIERDVLEANFIGQLKISASCLKLLEQSELWRANKHNFGF